MTDALLRNLSDTVQTQGILGLFSRPLSSPESIFSSAGIVVVLDGVQDPGNVGTIVRLCAAFEACGLLLTEQSADPLGPKAIRASAGAILAVRVSRVTRSEVLELSVQFGIPLFAADAGGDTTGALPRRAAIVFGNEGSGVSAELLAVATPVRIPMSERIESLNVASAAAILLAASYHNPPSSAR
jgi:TrmH family RNA methyltransferase